MTKERVGGGGGTDLSWKQHCTDMSQVRGVISTVKVIMTFFSFTSS